MPDPEIPVDWISAARVHEMAARPKGGWLTDEDRVASLIAGALPDLSTLGFNRLVVDLTGTDFMDVTGLGVLIGALKRARAHGGMLVVVCPPEREQLLKTFRITGMVKVIPVVATVEEALAMIAGS